MISKMPSATWSSPSARRCRRWNKGRATMWACALRRRRLGPTTRTCAASSEPREKRAAELESAGEELGRELALVQQAARGLEGDKAELTSEIVAARAEVANLESQLAQKTANGRALSEANQILVDHANSADKRIVELQSEGALMREKLLLLENGQALAANGARSDAGRGVALVASPHRKRERLDRRAGAAEADGYQPGGYRERARHAGDRAR